MTRRSVINGIGEVPPSAPGSGRAAENLTIDACLTACADAGIDPTEVDAIVKYTYDASISPMALAATLGCRELRFSMEIGYGGGSSVATIDVADALVRSGEARTVLCFRTVIGDDWQKQLVSADPLRPYYLDAVNFLRPVGWTGYLHLFSGVYEEHARINGLGRETLYRNAVLMRGNAARNRHAVMPDQVTHENYFAAPRTVGPFNRFDEYASADVACAVIVSDASSRPATEAPVEIMASSQSHGPDPKTWFDLRQLSSSYPASPSTVVAERIFAASGLSPDHIDVAALYDCTTFTPLDLLTQYGLASHAELAELVEAGELAVAGRIPLNPHGGDYAGGYSHGFRHILEAVRQLRGTADNQVPDAEFALVAAPQIGPTSGAILRRME
jgi:acetyl-CoA acetyltransferase